MEESRTDDSQPELVDEELDWEQVVFIDEKPASDRLLPSPKLFKDSSMLADSGSLLGLGQKVKSLNTPLIPVKTRGTTIPSIPTGSSRPLAILTSSPSEIA